MAYTGPSPAAMRDVAGRLRVLADRLEVPLDAIGARADSRLWLGPAADRFRSDLQAHKQNVGRAAEALRATASRLYSRAAAVEEELAAIARMQERRGGR